MLNCSQDVKRLTDPIAGMDQPVGKDHGHQAGLEREFPDRGTDPSARSDRLDRLIEKLDRPS